jgi:hypothetical protein
MSTVIWVHEECLNPESQLFARYPDAPALFVFDEGALPASLKQAVFLYECLLEMRVEIGRGDPAAELIAFAEARGARRIATAPVLDPRRQRVLAELRQNLEVQIVELPEFVSNARRYPLKRFSAFWKAVEKQLLPD